MKEQITFACMSTPRLDNLKRLLPKVLPYVDKAIIVVGKEEKETDEYLASLGSKVRRVYRKWDDSFANQWNEYLKYVNNGYILICDDDEVPSEAMLKSLERYTKDGYGCIQYRCNPIYITPDGKEDINTSCNYYRQMFFKWQPNMHYRGGTKTGCHQYLVGYKGRIINSKEDEVYYHIKSVSDEHRNAARNWFIYGIWFNGAPDGIQTEDWHDFRKILKQTNPEVETWTDLERVLIKGNIHPLLKDWMVRWWQKYNNPAEWTWARKYGHDSSPYNESKAIISYYFKYLHEEECPKEISF